MFNKSNPTVDSKKMGVSDHPGLLESTIIPRKFRWTLTNEEHPQIQWWMQTVLTDYINKYISIEVFDDAKDNVFNWLQALVDQEVGATNLKLTHLDGAGNMITVINFTGLKIKEHTVAYDYNSSDVLTHKLVISYSKISRTGMPNVPPSPDSCRIKNANP
jgi:hypothetical protein